MPTLPGGLSLGCSSGGMGQPASPGLSFIHGRTLGNVLGLHASVSSFVHWDNVSSSWVGMRIRREPPNMRAHCWASSPKAQSTQHKGASSSERWRPNTCAWLSTCLHTMGLRWTPHLATHGNMPVSILWCPSESQICLLTSSVFSSLTLTS